ncbi:MAG: TerB family tellurite resistance protein [Deltaproteobacteria bacterium]|nr:TerB family tellurite resistance protein [Deltaproteobacteria bacterium]
MDERVAQCLLVANVLVADGMMSDLERGFLRNVMDQMGLDDASRRLVTDLDGLDEAERVVATLPEPRRRELLDVLLAAVLVDGKISPHERTMVDRITGALGL